MSERNPYQWERVERQLAEDPRYEQDPPTPDEYVDDEERTG